MLSRISSALKAQPHVERMADPDDIRRTYRHWRFRTMYSMMIGYALFYFVRKNFSMAMPAFLQELHYTKTDLGLVLSLFSIVYGFGKFFNGILADRANPRYFMGIGLFVCALVNVFFGLSSGLAAFGIFWIMNAWFQAMGWPPCARMLTHWYSPKELGTKWGIWNASHQVGGAGILVLCGWLIPAFGWRSAFFIPAAIAIAGSLFLIARLRDTPQSLGLPPIEEYRGEVRAGEEREEETAESFKEILVRHILTNRFLWIVCLANIFVYIVRIGVLDWAPTFLCEAKKASLMSAGIITAISEVVGILGAISAGWISDVVFKGRRGPANVIFMLLVIVAMIGLWHVPPGSSVLAAIYLIAVKFLIYGPQMLVGVAAADFASKRAASTATGLTGTFGYLGSALCGVGTGVIVDRWGWDGGFLFFIGSAVIGTLLFTLTWKRRSSVLEAYHRKRADAPSAAVAPELDPEPQAV